MRSSPSFRLRHQYHIWGIMPAWLEREPSNRLIVHKQTSHLRENEDRHHHLALHPRHSCRATPPPRKKGRMGEGVPTQRSSLFRALRASIQDWSGWVQEPPLVALAG